MGLYRCPDHLTRQLKSLDQGLACEYVDPLGRWQVVRYAPQNGSRQIISTLERSDGTPLHPANFPLVSWLRRMDSHRWPNPQAFIRDLEREESTSEENKSGHASWSNDNKEMGKFLQKAVTREMEDGRWVSSVPRAIEKAVGKGRYENQMDVEKPRIHSLPK